MKRKIVQIAFQTYGDISTSDYSDNISGGVSSDIYYLCDDGTVWTYVKEKLTNVTPEIPED